MVGRGGLLPKVTSTSEGWSWDFISGKMTQNPTLASLSCCPQTAMRSVHSFELFVSLL